MSQADKGYKVFSDLPKERQLYYVEIHENTMDHVAARYFHHGQNVDIYTGHKASKGCNVIYHSVAWGLPKFAAKELATDLGLKVVISK